MRNKRITRVVVAGAICALLSAPSALGGGASSCPQSAGPGCERIGAEPDGARSQGAKQQQVRLAPRATFDGRGQQIWRAGNHLMN